MISISDNNGTIWEEMTQSPDSFEPLFLVPGKETEDRVRKICKRLDENAKKCQKLSITLYGTSYPVECTMEFVGDGKIIELCTGCGKLLFC